METKLLGLRTVIYLVSDLEAATSWYSEAFTTVPYFKEPFYVGFEIAGYELGLQPSETSTDNKQESVVAFWGVQNISEEYQRFIDLGAKPYEEPEEVGGGIFVAKVTDPWGNLIGLIFNPHFELPG
ncbi:VOC family protein [Sphingobacterium oryzagri]|uniref:VOC family protein n=1 Tax=Sphingobacterium oryzagri TaxID=3025669 RepID=A0ABY7WNE2_9SPHI|nr:VOC family protein [Sphingobacterium sp. KACC 22765]WDF70059.1 VOC family protein [Sphingobacterium sp. KACC 22765]